MANLCYRAGMPNRLPSKITQLVIGCIGATTIVACQVEEDAGPEADNFANEAALQDRPLPIIEPPLGRSRLLLTVARAASSHAQGIDDSSFQRGLDGKRFEVRLRFGCDGQGPVREGHSYSVDPDGETLRLRAVPTLSLQDVTVRNLAGDDVEAAGGFWLPRPWLLEAACPTGEPATELVDKHDAELTPEPDEQDSKPFSDAQRVGLAHFFTSADSRTRQRMDRPFEAVRKLEAGEQVGRNGFNLVLSGRLRARGDGRVILCEGSGRNRPPDCVISIDVDLVWIERPEDKAVLAEWQV